MLAVMLNLLLAADSELTLHHGDNMTVMSRQQSAVIESSAKELYQTLLRNKREKNEFLIALFYSDDVFSTRVVPFFDVTPQFFPFPNNVKFISFNAKNDRKMILRFRLHGFPTLVCFHKGKIASRLERTFTTDSIIRFVNRSTGISPIKGQVPQVWVTEEGRARVDGQDPLLHLSMLVIVLGGLHLLYQSTRRTAEPSEHDKSD